VIGIIGFLDIKDHVLHSAVELEIRGYEKLGLFFDIRSPAAEIEQEVSYLYTGPYLK
jgi:hypothetical protein